MRRWFFTLMIALGSGRAGASACEQLVLPFAPALITPPAAAGVFEAALARGLALGRRKDHALVKILRRELGDFLVAPTSVETVARAYLGGERWSGRRLAPGERARLNVDTDARAIFAIEAAEITADGAERLTDARRDALEVARGEALLARLGVSVAHYGTLAPILGDLAAQYDVDDDEASGFERTLADVWAVHEANFARARELSPLERARWARPGTYNLHDDIAEFLTAVGEPAPAAYRAVLGARGALVILRASAARRRTLVPDRTREMGSVLLLNENDALSADDVYALIPQGKIDAANLRQAFRPKVVRAGRGQR